MNEFLTINGPLVLHDSVKRGTIKINKVTGLIDSINFEYESADYFYPDECLVFPGFGDIHIHAREDVTGKHLYKESFYSASKAALNGGVTFYADMPNNPVPPIDDPSYKKKRELTEKSMVPVVLYAGIGPETYPLSFAVPYKVFMGPSIGDLFFRDNQVLTQVLERYKGLPVSFHCEDPEILENSRNEPNHELRRPPSAEIVATDLALSLIRQYDLTGKLCHYSTGDGLQKIIQAKKEGVKVTCEVTPTHLFFDRSMLTGDNRPWLQMNPPLRDSSDKETLLKALLNGDIDYLATDHAPHSKEEKLKGTSGVTHLDTYGAFVTWLISEKKVPLSVINRVCAENPGNFVKPFLDESKTGKGLGKLEPGYLGNITVLNMKKPVTINDSHLHTACGWSPFSGFTFPGSVEQTFIAGKTRQHLAGEVWL